jgi:hypothetical protein
MGEFGLYMQLGWQHISDLEGLDHILFIIVLCSIYSWQNWKQVVFLVTAFTVGHSITLALSALDIIRINPDLVELLIPITILITAITNLFRSKYVGSTKITYSYILAIGFGLIHGMGFSNFFRELMGGGTAIIKPLLAFNIGLEIGQIGIVILFFGVNYVFSKIFKFEQEDWTKVISGIGIGASALILLGS